MATSKVEPVFLRTPYNYDRNLVSDETGLKCEDPSLTQQDQAEDADINVIVRRFGVTGEVPITTRMPLYQDYDGVFDFRSAVETIMQAEEAFAQVPAEIRARFHNDPGAFADFCSKESNRDELQKMGLLDIVPPPAKPEPTLVRVVKDEDEKP